LVEGYRLNTELCIHVKVHSFRKVALNAKEAFATTGEGKNTNKYLLKKRWGGFDPTEIFGEYIRLSGKT